MFLNIICVFLKYILKKKPAQLRACPSTLPWLSFFALRLAPMRLTVALHRTLHQYKLRLLPQFMEPKSDFKYYFYKYKLLTFKDIFLYGSIKKIWPSLSCCRLPRNLNLILQDCLGAHHRFSPSEMVLKTIHIIIL